VHTVTFRRLNGTVLSRVEVAHGGSVAAPAAPAESGFTFSAWDGAAKLANVTNDVTCWALYEAETAKSPSTSISSQSVAVRETPYSLDEYFQLYDNLAWSDEFSETSLSAGSGKNWQINTDKDGQDQLQTYTTSGNVTVSDGTLKLTCKRESSTRITSGRIVSRNKVAFLKGRCEIRAKITKADGAFPAFWTMGSNRNWPWGGEIDIMEQLNGSDWIGGTLHMPVYPNSYSDRTIESNSGHAVPEDGVHWGDGFHRIGVIVNERDLVWYVDDHVYQRMDIRDSKYDLLRSDPQYVILNYAFGGTWSGVTNMSQSAVLNLTSEDFEIDYCRIFTNTEANKSVTRTAEPEGARLSGPVKATVWRGWQMNWNKSGSSYYMSHMIGSDADHIGTAVREYVGRDNPDIVTFFTRPQHNTGGTAIKSWMDVPGYTAVNLSPNAGRSWTDWDRDSREKLLSFALFNKKRFSQSDSSIGTLLLSNDYSFTNCSTMVAELVEKDTGAKVKVVGAYVSTTNGVGTAGGVAAAGFDALIAKLDAMKDEKVILLIQGEGWGNWNYLNSRVNAELRPSYAKIGQYASVWPSYQSAWATSNYMASAENPEPLSVPKANGQPSGVHTNQAFCATVTFDAPPPEGGDGRTLYVDVEAGAADTLDASLVTADVTNIVIRGGVLTGAPIPSYTGAITVESGVYRITDASHLGAANANPINVLDGATLFATNCPNNFLSGKTVNLYGGPCAQPTPGINCRNAKIVLHPAASLTIGSDVDINLKDADSLLYVNSTAWGLYKLVSGTIDLGGHRLTIESAWKRVEIASTITNGGELELKNVEYNVETIAAPTFLGTGTLRSNNAFNFKKLVSAPGWTITGSSFALRGNINRKPEAITYPSWDGPIVVAGTMKVADYAGAAAGVSNTTITLKGPVSGYGTISSGPGWLNLLSATNTFSGEVFVNGKSAANAVQPILAGGGGIGVWNGAAVFPHATAVTFTNSARLAFMDDVPAALPKLTFDGADDQSITGGSAASPSTIAGLVKSGAGTLTVASPVCLTAPAEVNGGTLKLAASAAGPVVDELAFAAGAADGTVDERAYGKKIVMEVAGYAGSTLTNFPVLVRLSTGIARFSYSDFRLPRGGDLRFTDADGKLIPHEIDTWDEGGTFCVWVKVPALAAGTRIVALYDCAQPDTPSVERVWDGDYVGVWHLGESALPLKESSGASSDFTSQSGTGIGYAAEGIVGGSVDFGAPQKSRVVNAPDHDALDGFTQCTFEAWTFVTNRPTSGDRNSALLSKRTAYANQASYQIYDTGSTTSIYVSSNNTAHSFGASVITPAVNAWTHQAYTFDAGYIRGYKDGVSSGANTCSVKKINAGAADLHLGNFHVGDSRNFPGKVDELRISKVVRSADWIKASHDTVSDAAFLTFALTDLRVGFHILFR